MYKALFLLCIALTAAVICISVSSLSEKNSSRTAGTFRKVFSPAASAVLWIITAAAFFRAADTDPYSSAWFFMAAVSTVSFIAGIYGKNKYRKEIRSALKVILAATVLELTVFNIPSYRLMFSGCPEKAVTNDEIKIIKGCTRTPDGMITVKNGTEAVILVKELNIPVETVFADLNIDCGFTEAVHFRIDVKDSTQATEYRYNIVQTEIISHEPGSNFALCEFSGDVSDIRIKFQAITPDSVLKIKGITFNKPVPFDIIYLRFFLIVITATFIYFVIFSRVFSESFSKNTTLCSFLAFAVTFYACLCAFNITDYKSGPGPLSDELRQTSGNQISQELVDAFEAGSVSLLAQPEDFLEKLDNPYDTYERNQQNEFYLWDHVYYNGKYYSYYGIAPVILLFLPYHLLTGYYFPVSLAVLIFSMSGITGLTMVYLEFIKKWFSDIPSGLVITGHIIIEISSGIWYSLGRADFYEIALAAGFAFLTWGVYFLLKANILSKGKISPESSSLSSLFMSLSVLSRPTLALYCIFAAVCMIIAVPRAAGEYKKGKNGSGFINRSSAVFIICSFTPMICLGLVQMIYNYVRFGSPLDFGIQYSLTINDFTRSQFHLKFSFMALYNYLFNTPVFSAQYPFVKTDFQYMNTGGYFYVDMNSSPNTSGLFMLVPTMFFYFVPHKALSSVNGTAKKAASAAKTGIPCLLIPVIIIASVWESGYAVRYMADFSFEAILGSYAIMFFIFSTTGNETVKKLIRYFICFSLVWVLYTEVIQIINQAFRYQEFDYSYPEIAYRLEQMIAFWK